MIEPDYWDATGYHKATTENAEVSGRGQEWTIVQRMSHCETRDELPITL
jgi:hypothetical protein